MKQTFLLLLITFSTSFTQIASWNLGAFSQVNKDCSFENNSFEKTIGGILNTTKPKVPLPKRTKSFELNPIIPLLDSIYYWKWDTLNNDWKIDTKIIDFVYDARNNQTYSLHQIWINNSWINYQRLFDAYDISNNWLGELIQIWDGSTWVNSETEKLTYDSNNNLTSDIIQLWKGGSWIDSISFNYDFNTNNEITSYSYKRWKDGILKNWNQVIITYDSINRRTSILNKDGGLNYSLELFTYDSSNNVTLDLNQKWSNNSWENWYQFIYTYDGNNKTSELLQNWDATTWVNTSKYNLTYDANGNLVYSLEQYWDNNTWVNYLSSNIVYDSSRNIISTEEFIWNGSSWKKNKKSITIYNSDDKKITLTQIGNDSSWVNDVKITDTLSPNHNSLQILRENWKSNSWVKFSLQIYTYDKNNFIQSYSNKYYNDAAKVVRGDSEYYFIHTFVTGIIDAKDHDFNIYLYPNPFLHELIIKSNDFEPKELILYDITSRFLIQQSFTNSVSLNTENLSPGIYFYEVRNKNGMIKNGKLLKE